MKQDWKSLNLMKILNRIEDSRFLIEKYKTYILYSYIGKTKNKYLKLLDRAEIPNFICLDDTTKEISYKIRDKVYIRTGKFAWRIPIFNKGKDIAVLTSISSLFSGKKQEACRVTSTKRRNPDGSYKGIDKTMDTLRTTGKMKNMHLKIIMNRRKNNTLMRKDKRTIEDIKKELYLLEPEYVLLNRIYKDNKQKLKILCDQGHEFFMRWNNFLSSHNRCPRCWIFKKEEECRVIFEKLTGKKFPKKRPHFLKAVETGRNLELDGYCESLGLAFEYDGEGHFLSLKHWGGDQGLELAQKRDKIKNDLCEKYGIILIRIPYFIENLEDHIREELNGKNIIN